MADAPHRPRRRTLATDRLRRWFTRPSPNRSAAPGRDVGLDVDLDLIADIVEMTRHAAQDGLPLSAVLDDLRLVLHLGPADVLPVDALRACALEWARASQRPATTRPALAVTLDDVEGRLWELLGSAPEQLPGRAVVVRLRASAAPERVGGVLGTGDLLLPADLLSAAAELVSDVFDQPGEHVVLLRTPPRIAPDRLVVLLPDQVEEDGAGEEDRLALCRATLAASPLTNTAAWLVEVHELGGHPDALLTSVREVLGPA